MTLGDVLAAARSRAPRRRRRRAALPRPSRRAGRGDRLRLAAARCRDRCSSRCAASSADGDGVRARRRSSAARSRSSSETAGAGRVARAVDRRAATRGSRSRCSRRRFYRAPERATCASSASPARTARRRRRICSRSIFEAAGITLRPARHRRLPHRRTRIAKRRARRRKRPDVQALLARDGRPAAARACAMEVSSHALALRRVDEHALRGRRVHQPHARPPRLPRRHGGVLRRQAPAVRDAAARRAGVVNVDDPRGAVLLDAARRAGDLRASTRPADVTPRDAVVLTLDGLAFDVAHAARHACTSRSTLVGRPNVYNILAAVATASALDLPLDAIEHGVAIAGRRARPVPGRLGAERRRHASSSTTRTPTTR